MNPTEEQIFIEAITSMPPWLIVTLIIAIVSLTILVISRIYPEDQADTSQKN